MSDAANANDEVTIEVERWKSISVDTINAFKDKETGMINEFAFMWAKRKDFPLHYFVFRQTASHLPHEGNVEQIFSPGGRLSDPNMNPAYLARLVYMGSNRKVYNSTCRRSRTSFSVTSASSARRASSSRPMAWASPMSPPRRTLLLPLPLPLRDDCRAFFFSCSAFVTDLVLMST